MSLTAAILFNAPPPVFHGDIRKIIAREMTEKPPVIRAPRTDEKSGSIALGRKIRAKIVALISDGNRWTVIEVADEVGISHTATRRHLNGMAESGIVKTTQQTKSSCREQTRFWITP